MKIKTIAMLLAAALMLSLTSIYVLAESPDVQITAGAERGAVVSGTEIQVPVSITSNPGLVVGRVNVAWDHETLNLTSITYGTGLGQNNDSPEIINDGSYLVSFGDYTPGEDPGENWEETGVLFTLNFEVLEGAEAGTYPITLTGKSDDFLNNDVQEKAVAFTDGSVELYNQLNAVELTVEAPVKGAVPQATMEAGTGYTAAIAWSGEPETFAANTAYTATVVLTPGESYGFAADATATVNGETVTAERNAEGKLVMSYEFPATGKYEIAEVALNITTPVKDQVPQDTMADGDNYTATISWNGDPEIFAPNTVYTATVVLTANENYVFAEGVTATVNDKAATATIGVDGKLTVTYEFPATESKDPQTITCENVTATYGDAPKVLEAVASDNGVITYAVAEGEDVISIADGKVTFLKVGTAKITVYAAETEDYAKAEKTIDVTVSAADYTYAMNALTQYVKAGSDLSKITVAAAAGTGVNDEEVSGSVVWYTDEDCTVAATADAFATVGEVTLYGAFTATNDNYVKTAKVTAVTFTVLANGDVNADGRVSTADAMIFFRYLANWSGYAERMLCLDAADVNNDGFVNMEDATHLARHLAGWNSYDI